MLIELFAAEAHELRKNREVTIYRPLGLPQPPAGVSTIGKYAASDGRGPHGLLQWMRGEPGDADTWECVGEEFRSPYGFHGDRHTAVSLPGPDCQLCRGAGIYLPATGHPISLPKCCSCAFMRVELADFDAELRSAAPEAARGQLRVFGIYDEVFVWRLLLVAVL